MKKSVVFILIVFLVILLSACQSGPTIAEEDLYGTWGLEGDNVFVRFMPDGTYAIATFISLLDENPADVGTYTVDGNTLVFSGDGGSLCDAGNTGTFPIALSDEGALLTTDGENKGEDTCEERWHAFGDYGSWVKLINQ